MLPPRARDVVDRYTRRIDRESPGLLQGLYLVGSVALHDFHDEVSDVDFIAVAENPDPAVLRKVHEGLEKFDGLYVTFEDLRTSPSKLPNGYYRLEGELKVGDEGRSPVEWTVLANHGVTIRGPRPQELQVHVDPDELREWVRGNANTYWRQFVDDPYDLIFDAGIAWGVLGISRLHYSMVTGDVTSKTGAGRHALRAFPKHRAIIEEALRHRTSPVVKPEHPDLERQAAAVAYLEAAIASCC
ncbi:aminoglycoside adenylyltransferase domain-containing protein [Kutzneria kofuensis]|uniref:Adenylyltransferase AadA C-terminal domain-containing protein n=1 Tax=Kutzneria kofuensis TaxID=103725 RepID=A0A7W9KLW8_9PSEU|nr:aminoglycoside adenylyltransferase domain-containing protein [Kutzneria kofuensis]MBB5894971.1 hypothetical protein [Kutzneria kofuensis]